jgi:hypothetical protein
MHHLTAEEVSSIWTFDQKRGFDAEPMRFKTLFHEFLEPYLQTRRDDWDNLSSDLWYLNATAAEEQRAKEEAKSEDANDGLHFDDSEIDRSKSKNWRLSDEEEVAYVNVESCEKACETMSDCMQWKYRSGLCMLDKRASLGRPLVENDNAKKFTSGWMVDRIKEWANKEECKGSVKWPRP